MNFISFKGPLNTYENINNGNISIKEANEIQNKFKLNLNEIARGKPKTKPKDKKDIIKNIKSLYESREEIIMIMLKLSLKLFTKQTMV